MTTTQKFHNGAIDKNYADVEAKINLFSTVQFNYYRTLDQDLPLNKQSDENLFWQKEVKSFLAEVNLNIPIYSYTSKSLVSLNEKLQELINEYNQMELERLELFVQLNNSRTHKKMVKKLVPMRQKIIYFYYILRYQLNMILIETETEINSNFLNTIETPDFYRIIFDAKERNYLRPRLILSAFKKS